jgi:hypothetical protein
MKQCVKCRKSIEESTGNMMQALFGRGGVSLSSSMEYSCKACGAVYCLDCMTSLKKQGGVCPKCGRSLGW